MARKKIALRPAMTRPATLRRGVVAGETRIYQEMTRLAAERTRVLQEHRMWAQKRHAIEGELQVLEKYREELLNRLALERPAAPCPGQPGQHGGEGGQAEGAEGPSGEGGYGVMHLRY